jgi:ubiquitin-protein ligase
MSNLENHNPQTIRQISKEVKSLLNDAPLEGIQLSLNDSNLTEINAVFDGPGE